MLGLGLSLPEIALRSARGTGTPTASLDLDFLSMVDGGARLTRSSPAYALDGYGSLRRYPENTPRYTFDATTGAATPLVEGAAVNLLSAPDRFDGASWVANGATVQADTVTAPDGSLSADTVASTATNAVHDRYQPYTFTAGTHTTSVYAKAGTMSWIYVASWDGTTVVGGWFDLTNGVVGAASGGASLSISSAGGGWYRCAATGVMASGAGNAFIGVCPSNSVRTYAATIADTLHVWGAQLETGTLTSYTPGTRAADVLSDPAISRTLKRSNLLPRSEEFDHATVQKIEATVTPNAIAAPDGAMTADKFSETAVVSEHVLRTPVGVAASTRYTTSYYLKAAERGTARILFPTTGAATGYVGGSFDLATGIATSVGGAATSIQAVGNGWYRCIITATTSAAASTVDVRLQVGTNSYAGVSPNGIYVWGGQVETGSSATAYIPTTSAAVTTTDIDYRLSLTRWGSATGINAYGQVATFAPNVPRFDPVTGELVREAAETNLLLNSGSLSDWSTTSASRTLAASTAPDGTATASRFIATNTPNSSPGITGTGTAGVPHTYSIHVKRESASAPWIRLRLASIGGAGTVLGTWFNVDTGLYSATGAPAGDLSSLAPAAAVSLPNGWWRIGITFTCATASVGFAVAPATASNSGAMVVGDQWLMWGAQLEANGLTSYIPTTTATASRPADTITAPTYTLDSRATYTGPSISWQGDPSGRLVTAPHNLLVASQDFSAANWTKTNATVSGSVISAPDGTVTGDKLAETAVTGEHLIEQGFAVVPATYTWSCFAKAAEYTTVTLRVSGFGTPGAQVAAFTLTGAGSFSATSGTPVCTISAVGSSGWYRCAITVTATSAQTSLFRVYPNISASVAGTAGSGVYIWGAQLERHPFARPYRKTTASAWFGPVFDYDATGTPVGLRIEEGRTNMLWQSSALDSADWTRSNASVTIGGTAPDGSSNANKLIEAATNTTHYAHQAFAFAPGSTITMSVYAKAAERGAIQINLTTGTDTAFLRFNLATGQFIQSATIAGGTALSSPVSSATSAGGGWWRIAFTVSSAGITSLQTQVYLYNAASTYAGDGTSGILVWGAQAEVGSFPTSYIATTSGAASRAADVASIPVGSWYNAAEGTLFAEVETPNQAMFTATAVSFGLSSGVFGDSAYISHTNNGDYMGVTSGGGTVATTGYGTILGGVRKAAGSYKLNDFAFSRAGAAPATDNTGAVPATATAVGIGKAPWGPGNFLNGTLRRVKYFNSRLPDSTLQSITT